MRITYNGLAAVVTVVLLMMPVARAGELTVLSTTPGINASNVPVATPIVVNFDRPLQAGSITATSFYAMGRSTGLASGTVSLSNGSQTVTLTPDQPFAAGETVMVVLANTLMAQDSSPLRSAGYSLQFMTRARPADLNFAEIQSMSNVTDGQTRIYGAAATDLNEDGWLDLTTVNEVSADLRVFMNLGDGSGMYGPVLEPPLAIGVEASPNDTGDFDLDGHIDFAVAAASSDSLWVALGNGDGTYADPPQSIDVGAEPHGVAVLDVDGDGDLDIVNANRVSSDLSLMINDGTGLFSSASQFDAGVDGEYGLTTGDMNRDGILDLVVAGRDGNEVRSLLSNGDGTFTQTASQTTAGATWVVMLGDLNGDGDLDATTANSNTGTASVLMGNGDGTFDPPTTVSLGAHTVSTDLGDLDGDGDLDWVISSFGGGFWHIYTNNGAGVFTFDQEITAELFPSCSIVLDIDNDRDLDLALTDEIADTVTIMKQSGTAPFGDFDNDDDVDGDDHASLAGCFSGSGVDAGLSCGHGDFDGDGDVDCADAGAFQVAWTGGGAPPTLPQCSGESVPTTGEWGMLILFLTVLATASLLLRRHSLLIED